MPQQQNVVVVFELLCKTDFSPRMLISSWLSSLCEAIMLPKPKHIASSASTQRNIEARTQCSCQTERLIIHLEWKVWWLLYMYTSGEKGVLLCYKCDNLKPPPCCAWQVQWVDVFWILSRGTGQDITPSDPKHCPLPTPKMSAFCLKPGWWQVPLTSLWSPGAAVVVNWVPTTEYTVLIPTNHFTPINNTWTLFPEDIFIAMKAKIYLIITNKLKSKFIVWPIRKVGQISHNTTLLIWLQVYGGGKKCLEYFLYDGALGLC